MSTKTKLLPESLSKPINLNTVKPSSLAQQLGLPADESDIKNHIFDEWHRDSDERRIKLP